MGIVRYRFADSRSNRCINVRQMTSAAGGFAQPELLPDSTVHSAMRQRELIAWNTCRLPGSPCPREQSATNVRPCLSMMCMHDRIIREASRLYWAIVMAERCAGTAVGDALASRRAVALGVPIASVCTAVLTMDALWIGTQSRREV